MRGELHTEFETILIHTAKCDDCNQHNKSEMFRCTKCGRHCCKSCWDQKGGDGRHYAYNPNKLTYTGPKAEPLPPLDDQEKKEKGGKGSGRGRKRAKRDDGGLLDASPSPMTDSDGLTEGSAAYEHKRRRQAPGGHSNTAAAASTTKGKHTTSNSAHKASATKKHSTSTTKATPSLSSSTTTNSKKSIPAKHPSSSSSTLKSPHTRTKHPNNKEQSPHNRTYNLHHAVNNLISLSTTSSPSPSPPSSSTELPIIPTKHHAALNLAAKAAHDAQRMKVNGNGKDYEGVNSILSAADILEKRASSEESHRAKEGGLGGGTDKDLERDQRDASPSAASVAVVGGL